MTYQIVKGNRGVTLIELMIVLTLSLLLMSAVYVSYEAQHKGSRAQEQVAVIQQDMRAVMDIVEKDIRNAGCDPCISRMDSMLYNTSGTRVLGVQMDLDNNTATCPHAATNMTHRRYYRDGTNNLLCNGQVLVANVTTFGVTYWDVNDISITPTGGANANYGIGNTLSSSEAKLVYSAEITLSIQSAQRDPDTGQFFNRTLQRRMRLRNPYENYKR